MEERTAAQRVCHEMRMERDAAVAAAFGPRTSPRLGILSLPLAPSMDAITGAECFTLAGSERRSIDSAFAGPRHADPDARADGPADCFRFALGNTRRGVVDGGCDGCDCEGARSVSIGFFEAH